MSEPLHQMRDTAEAVTSLASNTLPRLLLIVAADSEARAICRAPIRAGRVRSMPFDRSSPRFAPEEILRSGS
jgi:hypothetical protein